MKILKSAYKLNVPFRSIWILHQQIRLKTEYRGFQAAPPSNSGLALTKR